MTKSNLTLRAESQWETPDSGDPGMEPLRSLVDGVAVADVVLAAEDTVEGPRNNRLSGLLPPAKALDNTWACPTSHSNRVVVALFQAAPLDSLRCKSGLHANH